MDAPHLPAGRGETEKEMRIWIEGHYQRVQEYFTALAPNNFLSVWLEDQPVPDIAAFLGCEGNWSMPHENQNGRRKKKV